MAVSGYKCNHAIISKFRTILVTVIHPSLNTRQSVNKCINLRIDLGVHSRTFSSDNFSGKYIRESTFLCSSRPMTRPLPVVIKQLHYNPILCHLNRPHESLSSIQPTFSRTYSTEQEPEKKLTLFQRFKQMYRDYWYVLVPVHAVTSLAWFGGFYYLLKSGVDVVAILESYQISEKIINPVRDSSAGYLAVSYAMYKIFTPLRYTVTLGGTTLAINYLKKWGYIRPMPSREKLQEMYQERRENLRERKENILNSVRGAKDGISENKEKIVKSVHVKSDELKVRTDVVKDKALKNTRDGRK